MMRRLEEERDTLQNTLRATQSKIREMERQMSAMDNVSSESRALQPRIRELERTLEVAKHDMKASDTQRLTMENEIRQLRRELAENQSHTQKWKREAEAIR